jgi:hypothetical protein
MKGVMHSFVFIRSHAEVHGVFHVEEILQFVVEGLLVPLVKKFLLNHKDKHGQEYVQHAGVGGSWCVPRHITQFLFFWRAAGRAS